MARPRRVDTELVAKAQELALQANTLEDLRCAQAVLMPALLGTTLEQTAAVLGVGRATVARYQSRLRDRVARPATAAPQWGGRRHAAMSLEEEKSFLEPWRQRSAQGGVLVVSPIRAALAQRLGHPIAPSVVYRMLARHGWRKGAPDTRHPKNDPFAQEDWKKLPGELAALLKPQDVRGRKVRLMFQDEARFGRMVRIRRCWAPRPARPMVDNGYEREFLYV